MNFTDWLVNIGLIALVLRQIRWNKIDRRFVVVPLALVSVAVVTYLKSVPAGGNDLILVGGLIAVGITLGGLSAWATSIRADNGIAYARARGLSVVLWIVGIGSRMAFSLYVTNGGADTVARFSAQHDITSQDAWVAALVLMALAEVLTRVGFIVFRSRREISRSSSSRPVKVMALSA